MPSKKPTDHDEQGLEIPYQGMDPDTLRKMIQEFVSRDGADWGDAGHTMEEKVAQVLRQLKDKRARVVYDQKSQTANIVATV